MIGASVIVGRRRAAGDASTSDPYPVAKYAVWKFRRDSDHEDLLQEARIAVWMNADKPEWLQRTIAYRRAVDTIRRRHDPRHQTATIVSTNVDPPDPVDPFDRVDSMLWNPPKFNDATLDFVVDRLCAGKSKQAIAAELGVHPSRVSQHLRTIRSRWPG